MIKNKPTNAAIYCRATAKRGHFEPEDADILAYQTGSAMAFIRDHSLTFVKLYEDDLNSEGVSDDTRDRILKDSAAELIDVIIVRDMNVIAPDEDILEKLDDAFPLIIGAEDLYYTKEDFSLETFQFVDDASAEPIQNPIGADKYPGRLPYGYIRQDGALIADPEKAMVVREIFDAAIHGRSATEIKEYYLNRWHIPTPGRASSWNRETVVNILANKVYCGEEQIEAIVSKETFDRANAELKKFEHHQGQDPFPMARCDVCNSKLVYEKAGTIDRLYHTSYYCRIHRQKIRIEDFTEEVLRQCKEFLAGVDIEPDDQERCRKVIELGKKVLAGKEIGTEYDGIWNDWYRNCFLGAFSRWGRQLIRYKYSYWQDFDIESGKWIIRSIRLREDCSMRVGFWGDGVL